MSVDPYLEIKRMLAAGVSIRSIAAAKKCSRRTVREIRDGEFADPSKPKEIVGPVWAEQVDWQEILSDARLGHPIKYMWEDKYQEFVGYKNFLEQFHKRCPEFKQKTVIPRAFKPGDHCEVDYAGEKLGYYSPRRFVEVPVFVGILCCSQKIFATARPSMKSNDFLDSHREMYEFFGGVPKVTCPDNLKTGVMKAHLYDPDINKSYQEMTRYYGTVVVPTRVARPKDKALVENAVRLVMRYFRWKFRKHKFTSLAEINAALRKVCEIINSKQHTRFKISRQQRFLEIEKDQLQPLPSVSYEIAEWKQVKLHPDSHVSVNSQFYSAPHQYRGEVLSVKITASQIEVFRNLERIAVHRKVISPMGTYTTNTDHLPANGRAYYESVPQNLLSQARFISSDLNALIRDLFNEHTLGHLRRSQGLIREARRCINTHGRDQALPAITQAIVDMKRFNRIRVTHFKDLLKKYCQPSQTKVDRRIQRMPGNQNLRYAQPPK